VPPLTVELFADPQIEVEHATDGSLLVRSRDPLREHPPTIVHAFRRRAALHPDRVLATEPAGGDRRTLTWGRALDQAASGAQALLDAGLSADRPLMILSGNSLAHLSLILAAHTAGVPVISVSTAYSLVARDHERLRAVAGLARPGLVVADDAQAYDAALASIADTCGAERIAGRAAIGELLATPATGAVDRAFAGLAPGTTAKLLLTSGSTGTPKAVITTHRMLVANQQALTQIWPFLRDEPPVLVDWLPWSHTFGGNHNLNQVLYNGGTLHIDHGRPAPGAFDATVDALRRHPPTVYYNVPAGYALLAPRLEEDPALAMRFFSRLRFAFYAAAALPPALWEQMRALADRHADHHVALTASWGTTETAPAATSAHFESAVCGCIGVPIPGTTIKLTPEADKLEIRVKGPNVTPGYYDDPPATAAAFDADGFYRTGDAVRLVDPHDPGQGLMFDGRLAEDFKLSTGTWVTVGRLRPALISALGVVTDAVITGHDRDEVGALVWIDQAAAARACGGDEPVTLDDLRLRSLLANRLARHNAGAGSASQVRRLLILEEPPSIDAGEITDKGYVNQSAVLRRRADLVERLHLASPDGGVIRPTRYSPAT
jgi:feruloyl-CoA synthase